MDRAINQTIRRIRRFISQSPFSMPRLAKPTAQLQTQAQLLQGEILNPHSDETYIKLYELIPKWALEINVDPDDLRISLFDSAMGGLFDSLLLRNGESDNGLLVQGWSSGKIWTVPSSSLRELWGDNNWRWALPRPFEHYMSGQHNSGIRDFYETNGNFCWCFRIDAIWEFCRQKNKPPPSFWPFPVQRSPEQNLRRDKNPTPEKAAAIMAYLMDIPPRSMDVEEMERLIVQEFNVDRDTVARSLIKRLPVDNKQARGRPKNRAN